ncbi:rhomboid family intramembrane serine protease [Flavihumibacter profundi]|uniref:rhomboid family intramembrane serine protease n=1 Tax=Flavihumibacter profundi TaxID=2716883 RepID=UPI001CC45AB1|nr:rhomboid family intramembrane serine protease [Flavihumibacter profundi]MBZ5857309.1 rhomboid family intramembrane serine protease [Flavihumibacter profundi]
MTGLTNKLRLIYKPFLIIAIGVIAGYTLLNWLVFKKLQVISPNEDIVNIWIPFILPWIPILIWLRPRIKLLNLKRKKGDLPFLYILIAGIAIAIPTIIAQFYLETASGILSKLDNISQIEKQAATKYYTIKDFYIDKNNIGVESSFDVSGKNNQYFNMNLFIAMPILNSSADTSSINCLAWYGVKYHEQISNRLDNKEKEERFQKFAIESQSDFDKKDVYKLVYFDRIGNTDDHKGFISAIKKDKKYKNNSTTVLIPVNEPFDARNENKFAWIFGAFGIGALIWLIMVLIPKFDEVALGKFQSGISSEETDMKEALSFFLPREGFYISPIIMDLNILIFIIMVFSGLGLISFKPADLLAWGANFRPVTTNGEWWRLLTNTFLHGGLMHLLANMYGLIFVGIFLEPRLGKTRFAIIYLTTGILASLSSLYFHEPAVSIGASGAIFGLYGVFLSLLLTNVFPKDFSKAFLVSTLIFIGYNLLMGFAGAGIDNAAHIGGLLSGFIIGIILYPQLKRQAGDEQMLEPVEPQKYD